MAEQETTAQMTHGTARKIRLDLVTLAWALATFVLLVRGFGYGAPWFGMALLAVGLAGALVSAKWKRVQTPPVVGAFISLAIIFSGFVWLAQGLSRARELVECQHRQGLAVQAVLEYAKAHDGVLPSIPADFRAGITLPVPDPFTCSSRETWCPWVVNGFGYNMQLAGVKLATVREPENLVLFIDGGGSVHKVAGLDDIAPTRHGGQLMIASFCDGQSHTVYLRDGRLYRKEGEPVRLAP